jgi:hypothetical protein
VEEFFDKSRWRLQYNVYLATLAFVRWWIVSDNEQRPPGMPLQWINVLVSLAYRELFVLVF